MFESSEQIIVAIENLCTQLVNNEEELCTLSFKIVDKERIKQLQFKQEEMMKQLTSFDIQLYEILKKPLKEWNPKAEVRIRSLLHQFKKLNEQFLENIKHQKGVIQFELPDIESKIEALEISRGIPVKENDKEF